MNVREFFGSRLLNDLHLHLGHAMIVQTLADSPYSKGPQTDSVSFFFFFPFYYIWSNSPLNSRSMIHYPQKKLKKRKKGETIVTIDSYL